MTVSAARGRATATVGGLLLALLLTIPAIAPLTYPGFFEAHSGLLPAFNAAHPEAAPSWGRGAAPVRGEGALPYLLIRPFYALTGDGVAAVKWGYALAFLLAAAGMYGWMRRRAGVRGAVLAAAVYTYLPWHLATVYVRGAYAEAWLWAFWPPALYAVDRLAGTRVRDTAIAAVAGLPALAAAFWTQPGLAALFVLVLVPYALTFPRRRGLVSRVPRATASAVRVLRLLLPSALLIFLLWWVARQAGPAPVPFSDHYLYPFQLLSAQWGTGISVPGALDGLPFQLGLAAAGLSLVTVALWPSRPGGRPVGFHLPREASGQVEDRGVVTQRARTTEPRQVLGGARGLIFWCAVLMAVVLLALPVAAPAWRLTGLDALLTYPWQLLIFAGLPLAVLSGAALRLDVRLATWPAWAGLVALVLLASYSYLAPEFIPSGSGPGQIDLGREPVAFFQPVEAAAPQIALLDYDIDPPTALTPTLTITLTWQAVAPVAGDYTIFVHALDGGEKVGQQDTRPCDGECPTNSWQPGEVIVDRHQVALPAEAVGGLDRVAVGLYLLDTGERAEVYGQDDRTVYLNVR